MDSYFIQWLSLITTINFMLNLSQVLAIGSHSKLAHLSTLTMSTFPYFFFLKISIYVLKTDQKNMSIKTWLILTTDVSEQKSVMRR